MPTIIQDGDFKVKVYGPPREHPPAHVHVVRGRESTVIIELGADGEPPAVRQVYDMNARDVVHAYRLVQQHAAALRAAWERIHG
mgnify:CR=1 FL=1